MAGTRGSSAQTSHLAAASNRAEERGGPGAALARGGTGGARGMRAAAHRVPLDQVLGTHRLLRECPEPLEQTPLRPKVLAFSGCERGKNPAGERSFARMGAKINFCKFELPAGKEA